MRSAPQRPGRSLGRGRGAAGATSGVDGLGAFLSAAMAGDRGAVRRLRASDPGLSARAIAEHPDQLVLAAEKYSLDAARLLIELGFDVNARPRTAPLHEAAMRGNVEMIELLLEHGADPTLRDRAFDAIPAGWAEHHGQTEAQAYLAAQRGAAVTLAIA
jgi:ankyrin repeat protein